MYNLNTLERNVLITPAEVLFHAPTAHNLDIRIVEQSIIVAEERFIRIELGYNLYNDMVNLKNTIVTSANKSSLQTLIGPTPVLENDNVVNAFEFLTADYKLLWKLHLWKLIAECVAAVSLPEAFVQLTSEGAVHKSPPAGLMITSGTVTPLKSSMQWVMDKKMQDRIDPLVYSMHLYLCKNKSLFPFYTKECLGGCEESNLVNRNGGLALNLYADDF